MWTRADEPYQHLPPLPPTLEVETPAVLKAAIGANRELARLQGAYTRLPDPTILINLIPLMEAQASSEIENIVTTNDELFKAASGVLETPTPQVKEALRYREALRIGYTATRDRPLTSQTALAVCSQIVGHEARVRDTPGTYIGNPGNARRIYTPPEGRDVLLNHLAAWENFLHADDGLDPLVRMALSHYQFEAIHPFFDGNGRTGRIINILLMIKYGLIELPVLYLSGHIMRHKDAYYNRLNAVTREDAWQPWILFMLAGVESTARWTLDLVDMTDAMRVDVEAEIRAIDKHLPAGDLARLLFAQPYLRINDVVDAGLAQRQTASRWLTDLAERGLISKQRSGRAVVFVNDRLVDTLFHLPVPE